MLTAVPLKDGRNRRTCRRARLPGGVFLWRSDRPRTGRVLTRPPPRIFAEAADIYVGPDQTHAEDELARETATTERRPNGASAMISI